MARGDEDGSDCKAVGYLVKQHRQKNQSADTGRYHKSSADRHTVEERMYDHADERRNSHDGIHDLFMVRLYAEMQMGRERVFEGMNNQVPKQQQDGSRVGQPQAFREHLHKYGSEH